MTTPAFKNLRFTAAGREALLNFLRQAYGDRFDRVNVSACEQEAIDTIESDINAGCEYGQWELSQHQTASGRPEIFRAWVGDEVEVESETPIAE